MGNLNTLIVLLDGAADEGIPELAGETPLEHLEKRFMDHIASQGEFGATDSREYTHQFLLEFLTGKSLNVPRGLVEALGLGVPVGTKQVAYRFSPVRMIDSEMEWVYRVSREMTAKLQDSMVRNLDALADFNPRVYFYEDGRGVMTVDADHVHKFPSPPSPLVGRKVKLNHFEKYISRIAKELDGITVMPWGGGSIYNTGRIQPLPQTQNLVMVSRNPSALGVGGLLDIHREVVDDMWNGFHASFRLLRDSNVFMHIEDIDNISHRRAYDQKVSLLKEVDDVLMENIDQLIGYRVAVVIDHGTSSRTGQHLATRVPYAVAEVTEPGKPKVRFCEKTDRYRPLNQLLGSLVD